MSLFVIQRTLGLLRVCRVVSTQHRCVRALRCEQCAEYTSVCLSVSECVAEVACAVHCGCVRLLEARTSHHAAAAFAAAAAAAVAVQANGVAGGGCAPL